MKPEARDLKLVIEVERALAEQPRATALVRCFNREEASMLRQALAERWRPRVRFSWLVFDAGGSQRAVVWEGREGP